LGLLTSKQLLASLDVEPVKLAILLSAHENGELRIAYQDTFYGENNTQRPNFTSDIIHHVSRGREISIAASSSTWAGYVVRPRFFLS
jgi:hypothetical protein